MWIVSMVAGEHERNGMYEYANKIDTSGHVP